MSKTEIYLYGARDTSTGKLVSDISSPQKKFWQRKHACQEAIRKATQGYWKRYDSLELVTFKLVEVEDEPTLDQPCTNLRPTQEQELLKGGD